MIVNVLYMQSISSVTFVLNSFIDNEESFHSRAIVLASNRPVTNCPRAAVRRATVRIPLFAQPPRMMCLKAVFGVFPEKSPFPSGTRQKMSGIQPRSPVTVSGCRF